MERRARKIPDTLPQPLAPLPAIAVGLSALKVVALPPVALVAAGILRRHSPATAATLLACAAIGILAVACALASSRRRSLVDAATLLAGGVAAQGLCSLYLYRGVADGPGWFPGDPLSVVLAFCSLAAVALPAFAIAYAGRGRAARRVA